ncbi:hypothetical protein PHO31112_04306 [Pandoraea horticolens]|uniref:Uncharacterized protein n=1 Tax=Pandoraea horticolens TaxID=2508298 RepID=A0A5E4Y6T1_9BURK|nr:hypothetical protein [Pandoraea horticolens]VVE44062.1 hypothetical protein PHO31112_04306 [Pandoraea horticolens]
MNRKGPLRRIGGEDFAVAEEILKAATFLMLPEKTRAKFIEEQMRTIQHLRNEGCSWAQIKNLLAGIGIDLSESTLRSYYSRSTKEPGNWEAKRNGAKKNRQP